MPLFAIANYIEAALWIVLSLICLGFAFRPMASRRRQIVLSITLFIFGLSDIVEVETGAWWRPWWLFVWKAACVVSFLILIMLHYRSRRPAAGQGG